MTKRTSKRVPLHFERKWGGRREGAGRPRGTRRTVAHRARPIHRARLPLHVTVRTRSGLPSLREDALAPHVRDVIATASRDAFRVLHFSIQTNHVHLIVEATDTVALSRGMQRLDSRIARRVNALVGVRGTFWRERYHARTLASPRAVRNAIVYVLMNARKHGFRVTGVDAWSSAPWFDGFAERRADATDAPVRAPRTWLAGVGWRRRGLVHLAERPRAPD
ncbi:MAG TPA: transposase [Polyangiaceae bacterium]|jgi:REP element-mobilizing transposase RayT|nr:transposase [Polyangiaceae bacterium]